MTEGVAGMSAAALKVLASGPLVLRHRAKAALREAVIFD
jgi:hypothetical protein